MKKKEGQQPIEFYLLTHANEFAKLSNTGKLLNGISVPVTVQEWSRVEEPKNLLHRIESPEYKVELVFPSEFAIYQKSDESVESVFHQARTYVLLDGTWQQARKMYRKSPYLHQLPLLSVNVNRDSVYTLRRNQQEKGLCTAEVAACILEQEGLQDESDALMNKLIAFCENFHSKSPATA